jgi:hypothetical protein
LLTVQPTVRDGLGLHAFLGTENRVLRPSAKFARLHPTFDGLLIILQRRFGQRETRLGLSGISLHVLRE